MSTRVLDWLQTIGETALADLGWSAENPAPEEALSAVAIARGLGGMEHVPLMRWTGPEPYPEVCSRRVLATGRTRGGSALMQVTARFGDLMDAKAQARRRAAEIEAIERAGHEAWRIHQEQEGRSS